MSTQNICPFCRQTNVRSQPVSPEYRDDKVVMSHEYWVQCQICGEYQINEFIDLRQYQRHEHPEAHIVRGIIREKNEQEQIAHLTRELLENPRAYTVVPETPMDKLERMLNYLGNKSEFFGQEVSLPVPDQGQAIVFAKNGDEYKNIIKYMESKAKLIVSSANGAALTFEGWERYQQLKKTSPLGTQAFVAMSFDPALDAAYQQGIEPALKANGYEPIVRMKEVQHDGKICDRILLEIRRSRLLVADFTMHKAGVYYEAGFAQGLGIPVARTCHDDDKDKLHFDTRQYNHILWKEPADLQTQLSERIAALYALKLAAAGNRGK